VQLNGARDGYAPQLAFDPVVAPYLTPPKLPLRPSAT